jgi:hypothetical protein
MIMKAAIAAARNAGFGRDGSGPDGDNSKKFAWSCTAGDMKARASLIAAGPHAPSIADNSKKLITARSSADQPAASDVNGRLLSS